MADISVYPSTDSNTSSAEVTAGTRWDKGANSYRYVLVEDAALAANDVVTYSDTTGAEVTNDRSGGNSLGSDAVAGVALATVADGNYGVIQVGGVATMKVAAADGAISAGDLLVADSTDGCVAAASATTSSVEAPFAVALAADTATTSAAGTVIAKIIAAL
jgi:hypothetical protein